MCVCVLTKWKETALAGVLDLAPVEHELLPRPTPPPPQVTSKTDAVSWKPAAKSQHIICSIYELKAWSLIVCGVFPSCGEEEGFCFLNNFH